MTKDQHRQAIRQVLTPREIQVIEAKFFGIDNGTFLAPERVRCIEAEALRKLREAGIFEALAKKGTT